MRKDSTENEFIIKNKSVIVYLLMVVTFIILLCFADYYVLPASKTTDVITHYAVITTGRGSNPEKVSVHYYTQKEFTFSTIRDDIEENDVELEYSLLFKSITKVKSEKNDYTNLLCNGLNSNGIQFYFCGVLLISIAISLKILLSKKSFSENTFYNIICFNLFMIFLCVYMTYLY
ncbi:hypothetical protein LPB87_03775 [Flavobacterium sp. EDS]|uniref:hypothetical protein n=1 Tax=Flavobacterium sp. EDS TaxID=2897328 RepID=UPI001E40DF95|nr:hypothetical protein [Flavobacterium sp. EDS]MCD0473509.1 hypothetical protein [Flavobacterium sp. EDS]